MTAISVPETKRYSLTNTNYSLYRNSGNTKNSAMIARERVTRVDLGAIRNAVSVVRDSTAMMNYMLIVETNTSAAIFVIEELEDDSNSTMLTIMP